MRQAELDASRAQAEELFGDLSVSNKTRAGKAITVTDESNPGNAIDLSSLSIFNPNTKDQFTKLRETLTPLIAANSKKGQYSLFLQEFTKQIAKDLPSEQIKKIASGLTTLSNEKMKEEKAAEIRRQEEEEAEQGEDAARGHGGHGRHEGRSGRRGRGCQGCAHVSSPSAVMCLLSSSPL